LAGSPNPAHAASTTACAPIEPHAIPIPVSIPKITKSRRNPSRQRKKNRKSSGRESKSDCLVSWFPVEVRVSGFLPGFSLPAEAIGRIGPIALPARQTPSKSECLVSASDSRLDSRLVACVIGPTGEPRVKANVDSM
jgi:hypothetical protein